MTPENNIAWVTNWTNVALTCALPQYYTLGDEFSNVLEEHTPADRLAKVINAYDFDRDHLWASTHGNQLDSISFTGQCLWTVRRLDTCAWRGSAAELTPLHCVLHHDVSATHSSCTVWRSCNSTHTIRKNRTHTRDRGSEDDINFMVPWKLRPLCGADEFLLPPRRVQ